MARVIRRPPDVHGGWRNPADADALRWKLGFEKWAVLGHSFGGQVALEYALRYPESVSRLILLDTGGDSRWSRQNAADLLAKRGYSPQKVELVLRFFNGEIAPNEMLPALMRFGGAYYHRPSLLMTARDLMRGEWRTKTRPEALIFAGRELLRGWTVMNRLAEIRVPTLVMAGRDDFIFPPEHQVELAAGIPNARLENIERAGHNAHSERPAEVMAATRNFLRAEAPAGTAGAGISRAMAREVYVHESGSAGNPAVVFIHGGGPSGRMWRWHMDRLAEHFHCLAPDLPGFGRSNRLPSLSLADTADLVAELIDARVPARRAHVVGLSYGGSVVIAMLERHPDRIDRAVVDGAAVLPTWGGWGDRLVQMGVSAVLPIIDSRPLVALLGAVGLREIGLELSTVSPRAFRRAYREGFTAPLSRALLEAPCPTLLVAGGNEGTVRASNTALGVLMPTRWRASCQGAGTRGSGFDASCTSA